MACNASILGHIYTPEFPERKNDILGIRFNTGREHSLGQNFLLRILEQHLFFQTSTRLFSKIQMKFTYPAYSRPCESESNSKTYVSVDAETVGESGDNGRSTAVHAWAHVFFGRSQELPK